MNAVAAGMNPMDLKRGIKQLSDLDEIEMKEKKARVEDALDGIAEGLREIQLYYMERRAAES